MSHRFIQKYLPAIIFAIFLGLTIYLLKPFAFHLISAIIIVLLLNPVYKKVVAITNNKTLSAFFMLILTLLIVILPLLFVTNSLIKEAPNVIAIIRTSKFFTLEFIQEANDLIESAAGTEINLRSAIQSVIYYVLNSAKNFLFSLPNAFIGIFILLISLFYLFRDGKDIAAYIIRFLPYKKKHKEKIIEKIREIIRGVLYGHIITALVQGTIATVGYFIFGLKAPFFLGILTTFLALIPLVGPAFVYVPAAISQIITGVSSDQISITLRGIGLLVYGISLISTIDNFIKPKIISDHSKIHPLVIILGVFGGFSMLGFIGLILGPIIFAVFIELLALYHDNIKI